MTRLERSSIELALKFRSIFDWIVKKVGAAPLVAVLAGLTIAASNWVSAVLTTDCANPAVRPIRIEVTFFPHRFATLLRAAGGDACQANLVRHFWPADACFAVAYAITLSVIYLWVERWRRFTPKGEPTALPAVGLRSPLRSLPRFSHFVVLAPLVAGLLDAILENLPLWYAAAQVPRHTLPLGNPAIGLPVVVGSFFSAIKWLLLVFAGVGIVAESMRGPRGIVVRRARYSLLAVAIGALPLTIVSQGRDILQRLVEGEHPTVRIVLSVAGLFFAAFVVWYCARKILELDFRGDEDHRGDLWYAYFAEKAPRISAVALLALAALAFARAALSTTWFIGTAFVGTFGVLLLRDRHNDDFQRQNSPQRVRLVGIPVSVGRFVLTPFKSWRQMDLFAERVGMAVIAIAVAIVPPVLCWIADLRSVRPDRSDIEACNLQWGAWLSVVGAWLLYLIVAFRRPRAAASVAFAARAPNVSQSEFEPEAHRARTYLTQSAYHINPSLKGKFALALVISLAALAVFTIAPIPSARFIGPLWVLVLAIVNAVFFGTVTVWIFYRYRLPIVTIAILLAFLFSAWNDNHVVPRRSWTPSGAATAQPTRADTLDPRPQLRAHLEAWLKTNGIDSGSRGNRSPVILVAAAGGGLRAAYWTAIALAAAQDLDSSFVRHVFAISSVSGGSLGGALFVALAHDTIAPRDSQLPCRASKLTGDGEIRSPGWYTTCVRRVLSEDYLSPVLAKIVAPDFAQRFLPVAVTAFDRSTALEGSWETSYQRLVGAPSFSSGIATLTADSVARRGLPLLFLNSTHVETGRRYIAMPVRVNDAPSARGGSTDSTFADAVDVLGLLHSDIPLSGAVHNSARFTYVSPAGRLDRGDGVDYGHVVDGGYFENSGLATLTEIAHVFHGRKIGPVVVLYLCNDPVPCAHDLADTSLAVSSSVTNELMAPIWAVLDARSARGSMARQQLFDDDRPNFLQLNVCDHLRDTSRTSVVPNGADVTRDSATAPDSTRAELARERVVSPPLGWLLSRLARDWMDRSLLLGRDSTVTRISPCVRENARVLAQIHLLLGRH